ncbi:B12-binding domain-containing radical SAM protein, partial [Candidatus Woesearchaeota archaeon]|nr:B12-binding domain-containing radical SAM protein [Candidatus Woesearchaeota archaeon]
MKILFVSPVYPDTFWNFKYAIKFVSKKAIQPPLGLLTVAAMLPAEWEKKLVDMNIEPLEDEDIKWADYVFISAMDIQKKSVLQIVDRCKVLGVKTVAGGPLFTARYSEFQDVDHLILNEAEATLPLFLKDLEEGCTKHLYTSEEFPDIQKSPVPLWKLIDMKKYATMNIQYSRGCPFDCEFCGITALLGRKVRTKTKEQIIAELDSLYSNGWKGDIFFVDDNFIGNKSILKKDVLPAIIEWTEKRNKPFIFTTEASINLSDDEELMMMMERAGFDTVFVGIETPDENSLTECNKHQNKNRDLLESIARIKKHGFQVMGGFIVGFDSDPPSIFEKQIEFIQKSGIVVAMVGLLNAPRNSRLYQRLLKENRILHEISGDNTYYSINFVPKMKHKTLIDGYNKIIKEIYSQKSYYKRIANF